LEQEDREKALTEIKGNLDNWVMKPMSEGISANYFGNEILESLKDENLTNSCIFMSKINTPEYNAFILKNHKITKETCVGELGIYGIILSDSTQVHYNRSAGSLLRTKNATNNQGGILVGGSAIDCPYLVDMNLESITEIKYD